MEGSSDRLENVLRAMFDTLFTEVTSEAIIITENALGRKLDTYTWVTAFIASQFLGLGVDPKELWEAIQEGMEKDIERVTARVEILREEENASR